MITRAYIQGNSYDNDISKFAMVGTPNLGAVNAYYIWEGGDPKWADDLNDSGFGTWTNFYWNTTEKLYEETYSKGDLKSDEHEKIWRFIHNFAPEARDLLPTFNFLEYNGNLRWITSSANKNNTLIKLNTDPQRKERMSPSGSDTVVKTEVFYGINEPTIRQHQIYNPDWPRTSPTYEDGVPQIYADPSKLSGDGTVLEASAKLPCNEGWASCSLQSGVHSELVGVFAGAIADFMDEGEPACTTTQDADTLAVPVAATPTSTLSLSINGRVQPYLKNPSGQASGVNPLTGALENAINGATVSLGVEGASIAVPNPANGTYTVTVKGNDAEDYQFALAYMSASATSEVKARAFSHAATTAFTFTLNAGASNPITLNQTPLPPRNLIASAITVSGQLGTRLSWQASLTSGVTGYNIYARPIDQPHLTLLGTTTGTAYQPPQPWVTNAAVKTHIYAVVALMANGRESVLSNLVQNDDRDHDGLTDVEEIARGTNPAKADSDGDGLSDAGEARVGTDPLRLDTDGDGVNDYREIQAGTDPLDKLSVRYTLTVTKEGRGSGSVTSRPAGINCGKDCSEAYDRDTRIALSAEPAAGSRFVGWSGACTRAFPTCFVEMRADQKVTATFESRPGIFAD